MPDTAEFRQLFHQLDRNNDGRLSYDELKRFIDEQTARSNRDNEHTTRQVYNRMANKNSRSLDYRDFANYIQAIDVRLERLFNSLDHNSDGKLDVGEVRQGFERVGMRLSDEQVCGLVQLISTKSHVSWREWRDFFRFVHAHEHLEEVLGYWGGEAFLEFGDENLATSDARKSDFGLWGRNLIAGGLAGAISRTCTGPLDRIKIFMQVYASTSARKMTMFEVGRQMVQEGGVHSLWRGNLINVLKITPETAIKFAAFEQIKQMQQNETDAPLTLFQRFISGALAGFCAQSAVYPMEVLKTRLAIRNTGDFEGVFDCIGKIYRREGLRAFYRGFLLNSMGICGVGVDLGIYETLKCVYRQKFPNANQPSVLALLAIANTASTTAMFCTYPLFLIRTRMQSSTSRSETIATIASRVYRANGLCGFYTGSLANLAKVAPASSIGYLSYEYFLNMLNVRQN